MKQLVMEPEQALDQESNLFELDYTEELLGKRRRRLASFQQHIIKGQGNLNRTLEYHSPTYEAMAREEARRCQRIEELQRAYQMELAKVR